MTAANLTRHINAGLYNVLPTGAPDLLARSLMAAIFILAGLSKITAYDANLAYMASVGVPGILLPPVIALEVLGGLALVIGFQTRLAALLLAIFCISSALLFHLDLADQMQFIMFFKNLAMAGGLLLLSNQRPGPITIDRKLGA
jgi:putative oxidoreductase